MVEANRLLKSVGLQLIFNRWTALVFFSTIAVTFSPLLDMDEQAPFVLFVCGVTLLGAILLGRARRFIGLLSLLGILWLSTTMFGEGSRPGLDMGFRTYSNLELAMNGTDSWQFWLSTAGMCGLIAVAVRSIVDTGLRLRGAACTPKQRSSYENCMQIVYVIAVVAVVTVILSLLSKRQKDSAWQGTVTDVHKYSFRRNSEEDTLEEGMTISYRTDSGNNNKLKVNIHTFEKYYLDIKAGDRLMKDKGEYMPRLVR